MKLTDFTGETIKPLKPRLYPSYAPPHKWRNKKQGDWLKSKEWRSLRQKIVERDDYTCMFCGFRAEKWQIVDHLDGDPENNDPSNLNVICQMCNLVKHSGMGCIIKGIVDLYKKSKYSQAEINRMTRQMRSKGATDEEIIKFLGLEEKAEFKQDRAYLKPLFAFVTSRKSPDGKPIF